jgi:hypothetical protein
MRMAVSELENGVMIRDTVTAPERPAPDTVIAGGKAAVLLPRLVAVRTLSSPDITALAESRYLKSAKAHAKT